MAGRRFPGLMPPDWQLLHSAIDEQARFEVVPDPEIGYLIPPHPGVDRFGFLNEDPWPDHPTFVFLGDSLLTGVGVGLRGSFTHLIERLLGERVVNLGLPAAGVERQIAVFRRFGAPLHARYVVACLYLASDFDNDVRYRSWLLHGRGRPYLEYQHELDQQRSTYESPLSLLMSLRFGTLLEKSWMYSRVRALARRAWSANPHEIDRYRFPDGSEALMSRGGLSFARSAAAPDDPSVVTMMASIRRLQAEAADAGAHFVVVTLPSKEELFGVPDSDARLNASARVVEQLREAGIPLVDMYPAIREAGSFQSPYLPRDIHFNPLGHHVVADQFVAWFRQHGAL